jgi:flagellar hook assembly protein FlgD
VLRFRLARSAQIRLEVFDPAGRRVRTVWDGDLGVGEHELRWDGSNDAGAAVSAGLYFQRFRGDGVEEVQRVIRIP